MAAVILFVPKLRGATDDEYGHLPLRSKLDRMDPVGAALFIGAVCCLLLALTWGGQTYAWGSSRIVGLFVGFGAVTALFCFWLWRRDSADPAAGAAEEVDLHGRADTFRHGHTEPGGRLKQDIPRPLQNLPLGFFLALLFHLPYLLPVFFLGSRLADGFRVY